MSIKVFGAEERPLNPAANALVWMALDVADVFVSPLNGATVTITAITTSGGVTSIAFTSTGSFSASPLTLTIFQAMLSGGMLVRTSYRGTKDPSSQWPINQVEKAGTYAGETTPTA